MEHSANQDHDMKEFMETENTRNHFWFFDGVNNTPYCKSGGAGKHQDTLRDGHIGKHLFDGENP